MLPGCMYHMYNHANGADGLFISDMDYYSFLQKCREYLVPVADIFGYCLMPNHYHLQFRVKDEEELLYYYLNQRKVLKREGVKDAVEIEYREDNWLEKRVSKSFSNIFNSYAQCYNKWYERKGNLFRQNMKTDEIKDDYSFCKVLHYLHANPVHHGFVKCISEWSYSSFNILAGNRPTWLAREYVMEKYGGRDSFLGYHEQEIFLKKRER